MIKSKYIVQGLAAFGLIPSVNQANAQKETNRPNIIFILADDLGYGDIGCYGQKYIKTPNIDRIANEGILFTQHYSGAPVCAPARCSLMTGKHLGHTYVRNNHEIKDSIASKAGQAPIHDETFTLD